MASRTELYPPTNANKRLRLYPNEDHRPDDYEDLGKEEVIPAFLFSSLERHLPQNLLNVSRDIKHEYMGDILSQYIETKEEQKYKAHRRKIESGYKPLYKELRTMNASKICVPSFINAFRHDYPDKQKKHIEAFMTAVAPGVYAFEMLQPRFCEMLLSEVENIRKWVDETKFRMPPPNSMNKYSVILDDFGLEETLRKLMLDFVQKFSKVFFADVGGFALDSHHGFVVEYGMDRDVECDTHVDDSEVTLNVCLGKQFTGGDLFFRGVRCEKHSTGQTYPDEICDYSHSVGRAIIHHGRHRHGARATTSGNRFNLLLWCRSSVFRGVLKHKKDFSKFCRECQKDKEARFVQDLAAWQQGVLVGEGDAAAAS